MKHVAGCFMPWALFMSTINSAEIEIANKKKKVFYTEKKEPFCVNCKFRNRLYCEKHFFDVKPLGYCYQYEYQ